VIITFNSKHGPLSYHTDKYFDWHANVRAIALALEALRKVDRYGVSKEGSQYRGYKALPAAGESGNGFKLNSATEAADWMADFGIGVTARQLMDQGFIYEATYKQLAKRLHPDNTETGDEHEFCGATGGSGAAAGASRCVVGQGDQ
jgi:hypothetical protein